MQIRTGLLIFPVFPSKQPHKREAGGSARRTKVVDMEGRICGLAWLFLVLSSAGALQVDIPQDEYEFARGDNITLPCKFSYRPGFTPRMVINTWTVQDLEEGATGSVILTYFSDRKETNIKARYEGRVSVAVDVERGTANLKLGKITLEDNKMFKCRIQAPGDDEGQTSDTARLVVLVAPSTPICKIQGTAEYGQNINLTCHSEEGSPPPEYSWESQDVRNVPRLPDPRTTSKGGILSLFNISKDTSGLYICTSKNKIRSATCNVTLAVWPPSMNFGPTIGIIAGIVAALIILAIIIFCCCRKKKEEEQQYAMGVREEYTDKEPAQNGDRRIADGEEEPRGYEDSNARSPDRYEDRSERNYDRDYDDRRSDYDDRRSDYNDRRSDYNDRRSDYNDRRSDYDDRRSDYDDRRSDYTDRRDRYSDRHERYDDDRRYDDDDSRDRRYDDGYDDRYDDRDHDRDRDRDLPPTPPSNKPRRD